MRSLAWELNGSRNSKVRLSTLTDPLISEAGAFNSDFSDLSCQDPYLKEILVVDDEPVIRESLAECLQSEGFTCETAASGVEALAKMSSKPFALVISDIRMPDMDGLKLLETVSQKHPGAALMLITGVADVQTATLAMREGACDYLTKPFDIDRVLESVNRVLNLRRQRLDDKKTTQYLETLVQKKSAALHSALQDLKEQRLMTLEALLRALDARGHETHCHSQRVQAYAVRLAEQFSFRNGKLNNIARGALLHDIGKIGIPDAILLKPGKLTAEEEAEMRKHPVIGYQIVESAKFLDGAARIVLCHHERYDGSGYPLGLRGEGIPLEARIFSVLDTYDAITSDRPYREKLPSDAARKEIVLYAGTQFDPVVAQEFLKVPQRDWDQIQARYS